ncbi:MAG: DUF11 domain-containing protein, partial [Bacteroidales bacterium]|nr:DUF11 domain-containing protein [Bacteroidales bacterium]
MRRGLFTIIIFISALISNAQSWNPYVNQGIVAPAPLLPAEFNGTGTLSFNVGNTGITPLHLVTNQEMGLVITLSKGVPDNADPIAALGGTWLGYFDWTYNSGLRTYFAIQNQEIPGASQGNITIAYKVAENTSIGTPQNGFNVNVQPPSYTNGFNTTNDDAVSSYTYVRARDYGDAPLTYGAVFHEINLFKNAANTQYLNYMYLGNAVDPEPNYQPSANADADNFDDGVNFPTLIVGSTVIIPVTYNFVNVVPGSVFGFLNAWIDWNGNGVFQEDEGERISTNQFIPAFAGGNISGTINLTVNVPLSAITSTPTFARFRFGNFLSLASEQPETTWGEVEDYQITILNQADVSVVKTVQTTPATSVVAGGELIYKLVVNNAGPSVAQNVVLTDLLNNLPFPSPQYSTTPLGPWSNWLGSISIGSMQPSASVTYYIKGTLSINQCTDVSNIASVTTTTDDTNPLNNESSITTPVYDATDPAITTCAVTLELIGCNVLVITSPAYSETLANSSENEFENSPNNGDASDNCGITSVQYIDLITSGVGVCPIVVTRTWYIIDAAGNTETCVQTITVTDIVAPVWDQIAGALDANLACENTAGLATALALAPTATD